MQPGESHVAMFAQFIGAVIAGLLAVGAVNLLAGR
jgi:hypothetical protein